MRLQLMLLPIFVAGCSTSHREADPIVPRIHEGDQIVAAWIPPQGYVSVNGGSWQFVTQPVTATRTPASDRQAVLEAHRASTPRECAF